MTDAERIEAIRTRLEKATAGSWHQGPHYRSDVESRLHRICECKAMNSPQGIANAEFIAHAREDIPWLLDALDRQRERIDVLDRAGAHQAVELRKAGEELARFRGPVPTTPDLEKENAILRLAIPLEDELHDRIDTCIQHIATEQGFTLTEIARLLVDCQRRMAADWTEVGSLRRQLNALRGEAQPHQHVLYKTEAVDNGFRCDCGATCTAADFRPAAREAAPPPGPNLRALVALIERECQEHHACLPPDGTTGEGRGEYIAGFHGGLHWVLGRAAALVSDAPPEQT